MRTEVETYLRLEQIIGTKLAKPRLKSSSDSPSQKTRKTETIHYDGILAVSRSAFFAGVRGGKYPAPIKLGSRTAVWAASSLIASIEALRDSTTVHPSQTTAPAKMHLDPVGEKSEDAPPVAAETASPRRGPGRPRKQAA